MYSQISLHLTAAKVAAEYGFVASLHHDLQADGWTITVKAPTSDIGEQWFVTGKLLNLVNDPILFIADLTDKCCMRLLKTFGTPKKTVDFLTGDGHTMQYKTGPMLPVPAELSEDMKQAVAAFKATLPNPKEKQMKLAKTWQTLTPAPIVLIDSKQEARELTDKIRSAVQDTWDLLNEAYERQAWKALGYENWRTYAQEEFGMSQARAYQLLDHAKVKKELTQVAGATAVDKVLAKLPDYHVRAIKPKLKSLVKTLANAPVVNHEALLQKEVGKIVFDNQKKRKAEKPVPVADPVTEEFSPTSKAPYSKLTYREEMSRELQRIEEMTLALVNRFTPNVADQICEGTVEYDTWIHKTERIAAILAEYASELKGK